MKDRFRPKERSEVKAVNTLSNILFETNVEPWVAIPIKKPRNCVDCPCYNDVSWKCNILGEYAPLDGKLDKCPMVSVTKLKVGKK